MTQLGYTFLTMGIVTLIIAFLGYLDARRRERSEVAL